MTYPFVKGLLVSGLLFREGVQPVMARHFPEGRARRPVWGIGTYSFF